MKKITTILVGLVLFFLVQNVVAQEEGYQKKIETLKRQKDKIAEQEKRLLKQEIEEINKRLESKEITKERADVLKTEAAKKRALNIDDRLAIIDNRIALLQRNKGLVNELDTLNYETAIQIGLGGEEGDGSKTYGLRILKNKKREVIKKNIRTYSGVVLAFGLNNAITEGESFAETPFQIFRSRFFEIGYAWDTRIVPSDRLRIKYGVSFQFNGLRTNNEVFLQDINNFGAVDIVNTNDALGLADIRKIKLRSDSFIFPVHLEFGSSEKKQYGDYVRYSRKRKFKIGIGGYIGFNYNNIQKLRGVTVDESSTGDGTILDDDFALFPDARVGASISGPSDRQTIYGLSGYIGRGDISGYFKYQLTPIFQEPSQKRQNISLGLRFDL